MPRHRHRIRHDHDFDDDDHDHEWIARDHRPPSIFASDIGRHIRQRHKKWLLLILLASSQVNEAD